MFYSWASSQQYPYLKHFSQPHFDFILGIEPQVYLCIMWPNFQSVSSYIMILNWHENKLSLYILFTFMLTFLVFKFLISKGPKDHRRIDVLVSQHLTLHSFREDVERSFCRLQILAKSQLAPAVTVHLHTLKTVCYVKSCSSFSLLLRSTSCVPLKSAHRVMGLASRDALASDGKEHERFILRSPDHTPMSSRRLHRNTHEWASQEHPSLKTAWELVVAVVPYDSRTMI